MGVLIATFPRSGHSLLMHMVRRIDPTIRYDRNGAKVPDWDCRKEHDWDLGVYNSLDHSQSRYIVQYRHPVRSVASVIYRHAVTRNQQDFNVEYYAWKRLDFWIEFAHTWILNSNPIKTIRYGDLLENPKGIAREVATIIKPDTPKQRIDYPVMRTHALCYCIAHEIVSRDLLDKMQDKVQPILDKLGYGHYMDHP